MTYRPRNRVWRAAALSAAAVTLADMRAQARVSHIEEDDVIDAAALAATGAVERRTQRLLIRRNCTLWLPGLPLGCEPVELPGGEVGSITSVTVEGVAVAGAVAYGDSPAVLVPATDWPVVTGQGYPVVIVYEAGYAVVPPQLVAAVKLIAAEMFERRSQGTTAPVTDVPVNADWLMRDYRIMAV